MQRSKRSWKQNQMEGEGCYVRGAPTVTISASVRAKLLLGWLFQFRSIYLTVLFCTVCDWLKISGHFLEQLSIKPGNSSLFYKLKALRHEEQTWGQIFLRLKIPWILAYGLSSTEQCLSVSDLFRARRTLKRKWGVFEQAIKYKTKWEKTLDSLTNQANALNRDINYEFSFPHHAIKEKNFF